MFGIFLATWAMRRLYVVFLSYFMSFLHFDHSTQPRFLAIPRSRPWLPFLAGTPPPPFSTPLPLPRPSRYLPIPVSSAYQKWDLNFLNPLPHVSDHAARRSRATPPPPPQLVLMIKRDFFLNFIFIILNSIDDVH